MFVQRDQQRADPDDRQIGKEVDQHAAHGLIADGLALKPDPLDAGGQDELFELIEVGLEKDNDARELEAARRRTGAGAPEHQKHQEPARELRPFVKVGGGKARGAHDSGDLEIGVAQSLAKAADAPHDVQRNRKDGGGNGDQINAQLLALENGETLPQQDKVEEVEVDAEKQHEGRHDHLDIHTVEAGNAGRSGGKTARARRGEGVENGVVKIHTAEEQENHLDKRQARVDHIEDAGGLARLGHKL